MCHLISSKMNNYNNPQQLNIGDKTYKNILGASVRDVIDGDNMRKQVYFLDGCNSSHVSYVQADKVIRTTETFNRPVTRCLGGKLYNNITSKQQIAGKNYSTYIVQSPSGSYNEIREYKSGHVLDTNELKSKVFKRKLLSPFKKLAQIIR